MLWEEEVAKKREETEDLQKKLQEASAMQAGFLPLTRLDNFIFHSSCICSMDNLQVLSKRFSLNPWTLGR